MSEEVKNEEVAEEKAEVTPETSEEATEEKSAEVEKTEESKVEPADEGVNVEIPEKFKTLVESIEKMSVIELNELVKLLEKKFGVSAVAAAAPAGGATGGDAGGDEKDEFTVHLADVGGQKIAVIKVIKEVAGLGLKEAKDMVDGAPVDVKVGIKKEEAEEIKSKLEEAGAKVELK